MPAFLWSKLKNAKISSLAVKMTSSQFTGSITSNGKVTVSLDDESVWTLTGDSVVSELNGNMSNIVLNGYSLTVNGEVIAQ